MAEARFAVREAAKLMVAAIIDDRAEAYRRRLAEVLAEANGSSP